MTKRSDQISLEPRPLMRHEIYRKAIEHFGELHSNLDPYETMGSVLGHSSKWMYSVCAGTQPIDVLTEENLFRNCIFPEGFHMKMEFVFPIEVKR